MLQIENICCERGDRRLFQGLSFAVGAGESMHVVGHNGSGKTTLLRALAGLLAPTEGTIRWREEDIRDLGEEYHQELAYLGHLNGNKGDLSVYENLRVAACLAGRMVTPEEVTAALRRIGLHDCEDLPARILSQGQQRRVALARLFLTKAALWVLDEPFVALDTAAVATLQHEIDEHLRRGGIIVLTAHHEVQLNTGAPRLLELGRH
ncbi:MAG: cytochrome c biogenesis heme-transporting ATPase CcmA [Pseudomonadota bacterium]